MATFLAGLAGVAFGFLSGICLTIGIQHAFNRTAKSFLWF